METKAERFHIHNFYLLISGKRQTREGCLTDGNDQGIDFQVDINQDMLELYCSPNWQKMPLYTKCRISQNLAERGKDEKDIQKNHCFSSSPDDGSGDHGKCSFSGKW